MKAAAKNDPMAPEVKIRRAVEEGMENIFFAVYGEGNSTVTTFQLHSNAVRGVQTASARTVCVKGESLDSWIEAEVPISHPDVEHGNYRIADTAFAVHVTGKGEHLKFEAWCENNPSLGAKVVVRQTDSSERRRRNQWTVADSMACEVLYQGLFTGLPTWAKEIAAEHWTAEWIPPGR